MNTSKKINSQKIIVSNKQISTLDTSFDKVEIEKLKKLISNKVKDPKLAKKATQIILELIHSKV